MSNASQRLICDCRRHQRSCESALSEAFHLLGPTGTPALAALLRRTAVVATLDVAREPTPSWG